MINVHDIPKRGQMVILACTYKDNYGLLYAWLYNKIQTPRNIVVFSESKSYIIRVPSQLSRMRKYTYSHKILCDDTSNMTI